MNLYILNKITKYSIPSLDNTVPGSHTDPIFPTLKINLTIQGSNESTRKYIGVRVNRSQVTNRNPDENFQVIKSKKQHLIFVRLL